MSTGPRILDYRFPELEMDIVQPGPFKHLVLTVRESGRKAKETTVMVWLSEADVKRMCKALQITEIR